MGSRPVKGEPLARALRAHGGALSAGEAALLAERLLSLIQQGLIVPGKLRAEAAETAPSAEEPEP
jgi:hypothetical protein